MKLSRRESVLGLSTLTVVLFAVTALLGRSKVAELREVWERQAEAVRQIELDRRLVDQRDKWETKLGELSRMLPVHPAGREVDVYWLAVMDRAASKHDFTITNRRTGDEKREGEVFELPIDVRDWEADLDSLVHFLFELQSEGAMFDVRHLLIKPKPRAQGRLRGRFTLYCAYTRQQAGETPGEG
jgi:hypothetical protein